MFSKFGQELPFLLFKKKMMILTDKDLVTSVDIYFLCNLKRIHLSCKAFNKKIHLRRFLTVYVPKSILNLLYEYFTIKSVDKWFFMIGISCFK